MYLSTLDQWAATVWAQNGISYIVDRSIFSVETEEYRVQRDGYLLRPAHYVTDLFTEDMILVQTRREDARSDI